MSFWDVMSLLGSLLMIVLVLALTWIATRWYARRVNKNGGGSHIRIVDKTAMGAGTSLAVVQVGEKYYLLGVGDKNVNLLSELEDFDPVTEETPVQQAPFAQLLRQVMDRRTGRGKNENGGDRS